MPAPTEQPRSRTNDLVPPAAGGERAALAELRRLSAALTRQAPVLGIVQAAAAAAGGFLAGAAVVGLAHRRRRPPAATKSRGRRGRKRGRAPASRGSAKAPELVQIVGSRSLLVDVHLLGER